MTSTTPPETTAVSRRWERLNDLGSKLPARCRLTTPFDGELAADGLAAALPRAGSGARSGSRHGPRGSFSADTRSPSSRWVLPRANSASVVAEHREFQKERGRLRSDAHLFTIQRCRGGATPAAWADSTSRAAGRPPWRPDRRPTWTRMWQSRGSEPHASLGLRPFARMGDRTSCPSCSCLPTMANSPACTGRSIGNRSARPSFSDSGTSR